MSLLHGWLSLMIPRSSIAYRMARIIVLLTLFLGLLIGSVQVVWDYQQRLSSLDRRVQEVLNSIEKAAQKAVYTFDIDLASEVAAGLFEFPPVTHVNIQDENKKTMIRIMRYPGPLPFKAVTKFLFEKEYIYHTPLYLRRNLAHQIGTLSVHISPHDTAAEFWQRSITILLAALLQSFIISIVLLFIFHKQVTRPLHTLANDFKKIDPEKPEKTILSLQPFLTQTEFEEVTRAGNNLLRVIGRQLSASEQAERELKRQKNETDRYLKIAEAIILQLDNDSKVLMINQRGLDVMGYQLHEVLGKDWFDLAIKKPDRPALQRVFQNLFPRQGTSPTKNQSSYNENSIITKTGEHRLISWHNALETDTQGNPTGILSSGQDITARKEAEKALQATEGSLRAIIEATSEGFAITDLKTMALIDINSSLHNMLGYQRDEMLLQPLTHFIYPGDQDILASFEKVFHHHPHRSIELRMQSIDGAEIPVEISASNLPYSRGENPKFVIFVTNITARKKQEQSQNRLEKQLRQAQKMETIGTLAGGIAHDFNNILTPILGYASMLSTRIPKDDPNHGRIEQIAKAANRAADMVRQILSFSRQNDGEISATFLAPTIKEAMELVRATTPSHIEIKQSIDETCPPTLADSTQIQQMLLNLCTNAAHAMDKEGGVLEVRFEKTEVTEKLSQSSASLQAGMNLLITVSDTGRGMTDETLNRIFDPFFTTKKSGEGTGLGLAMVHSMVLNHQGDIFVESVKDKGSTFRVYLPLYQDLTIEKTSPSSMLIGNQEHALIVDDEPLNTEFLEQLLREMNYTFDSFNDSVEALDAFMRDPKKYQIILTDQTMPKLTGDQLTKAMREILPDIPIVMMSGYDKTTNTKNLLNSSVNTYIQKPVSISTLSRAMSELLKHNEVSD